MTMRVGVSETPPRSRAQTWICGVTFSWGSYTAVGPAGPPREPSPIFRGEVRLNYEEWSLSLVCLGLLVTVAKTPYEQETPADQLHSPSV